MGVPMLKDLTASTAMVAAIIDALGELQKVTGGGRKIDYSNPYLLPDSGNPMALIGYSASSRVNILSLTRLDTELVVSEMVNVLSLYGSAAPYIMLDGGLISPALDELDFYAKKLKKSRYYYRLGKYDGFGSFHFYDDGSVDASLCENDALQPMSTGLIVDARRLKLKKGDVYQLMDSKAKILYRGKVLLLKNNLDWREKEAFSKVDPEQVSDLGWNPKLIQAKNRLGNNKLIVRGRMVASMNPAVGIKKILEDGHVAVVVPPVAQRA